MDAAQLALVAAAALGGGLVNALAGGGSLITFPALVACGLSSVSASLTNTIAMCPGYLGATFAQRKLLADQARRAAALLPVAALGGAGGALLLLHTGEAAFNVVVPFLILLAVAAISLQDRLRAWIKKGGRPSHLGLAALPVGLAAIYGGYFGAGLGVIILAALAVVIGDSLVRINALKQAISLATNVTAAGVFVVTARVDYTIAAVMAIGSLAGGLAGGSIASRVSSRLLRALVITIGLVVAAVYLVKLARQWSHP